MTKLFIRALLIGVAIFWNSGVFAQATREELAQNLIYMELKDKRRVSILLYPDTAPKHVERFKKLVDEGFYNGLAFHRVLDGFMAQTGDPTGTGQGGSPYPNLAAEFTEEKTFGRGTIGAARFADPDSANSQFFICFEAAPWLNGKYTIFGKVIAGMKYVDMIKKGAPRTGKVDEPDTIVRIYPARKKKK